MKNIHMLLITAIVIVSGLMIPIEPAQATQPYTTTRCHYLAYDTEFSEKLTEEAGDVSCAPFPSGTELNSLLRTYGLPTQNQAGSGPNVPEEHCRIIRIVITEY